MTEEPNGNQPGRACSEEPVDRESQTRQGNLSKERTKHAARNTQNPLRCSFPASSEAQPDHWFYVEKKEIVLFLRKKVGTPQYFPWCLPNPDVCSLVYILLYTSWFSTLHFLEIFFPPLTLNFLSKILRGHIVPHFLRYSFLSL